jgi:hypothetical protein
VKNALFSQTLKEQALKNAKAGCAYDVNFAGYFVLPVGRILFVAGYV